MRLKEFWDGLLKTVSRVVLGVNILDVPCGYASGLDSPAAFAGRRFDNLRRPRGLV